MACDDLDPRLWSELGSWDNEHAANALARSAPFGRRFIAAVFAEFPALAASANFLRWSEMPDHVFAVLGRPGCGAGVQIDPYAESVIVWGAGGTAEYGNWEPDQVPPAVEHVRRLLGT